MKIGQITLRDPAIVAGGVSKFGPEIETAIASIFEEAIEWTRFCIPGGDTPQLKAALLHLCDEEKCPLVLTFGGTGPGLHDMTPDITLQILDRELPGFGEVMRYYSYEKVRTAILSRAVAGIRGRSLVINLPSRPRAVKACLKLIREAVVEGLGQIAGVRPRLRADFNEIPLEKFLPFLKVLRTKNRRD